MRKSSLEIILDEARTNKRSRVIQQPSQRRYERRKLSTMAGARRASQSHTLSPPRFVRFWGWGVYARTRPKSAATTAVRALAELMSEPEDDVVGAGAEPAEPEEPLVEEAPAGAVALGAP